MAYTAFATGDSQTVKRWAADTFYYSLSPTLINKLMGKGKKSIIYRRTDLERMAGDTIRYDLLKTKSDAPITGDNKAEGNLEAMTYYQDSVTLDQMRMGHSWNRMSEQRSLHGLRSDARENISYQWADKIDDLALRMLGGDTTQTFGQTGVAPDTDHYILCGDGTKSGTIATDEASIGAGDEIDLEDLDYAKERAVTIDPMMVPANFDGKDIWVAVVHPYSLTDLRLGTNTNALVRWPELEAAAGVRGDMNKLFSGASIYYNDIIVHTSTRIYTPTSNVRRNLFLGAQAGCFALGNAYSKEEQKKFGKNNMMNWSEKTLDHGNIKEVVAGMIWGVKATIFNSKNFGSMVMTSYSASHSG